MPSLKNLVRHKPDRPTLRQRAAALQATAARVIGRSSAPHHADAETIAADDRFCEAEDACSMPPMPVALRVWNNDWIFNGIPQTRMTDLGGGKARVHPYGREEVEFLRANPCTAVYVGGSEGELQPDGVSRLRPDKQAQARADAIIAAWDEWQAASTAAREAADLPAIEAAGNEARTRRNAALLHIQETPARSSGSA